MNLKLCPLLVTWDDVDTTIFFYFNICLFLFLGFWCNLRTNTSAQIPVFNPSPCFQSIPLTMIQLCCDMTTMVTFTSPFRATVYPWNCHSGRLTNSAALRNRKSMQKSEWKLRSKYSNSNPQSRFQKVIAYFKKPPDINWWLCTTTGTFTLPAMICLWTPENRLKHRKNCESC